VHHCLAIIPFRLEDVPMSKKLEYYVSDVHWLDALSQPLELHINKLCRVVQKLLTIEKVEDEDIKEAFRDENIKSEVPGQVARKPKMFRIIIPVVIVTFVLIAAGAGWFFRHRSAKDMVSPSEKASGIEKTIVVLPFKNLTGENNLDYLVQGQSVALTTELSQISQVKALRVISGITASKIANTTRALSEIALENKIDFMVEGSVLNAGDSVIIDLSIIKAYPEEKTIFAERFKSDISNVFNLYKSIAYKIVSNMGIKLTQDNMGKLPAPIKVNGNAYRSYLRGSFLLNYPSEDSIKKGFDYLNKAIAMDPADPYAYTYFALGYLNIAHSPNDPGDAMMKAEAAALRSLSLDTTIAETYSALAQLDLYMLWKWSDAEKYFKKALALDPNSAITHYHYAWGLCLWGRMDEAIAEHKLAQKYDPFDPQHTAWLGQLYRFKGQDQDAIKEAQKSLEIQKDYPVGYLVLGAAYEDLGRYDEAMETYEKLVKLAPEFKEVFAGIYIRTGHPEKVEKLISEIESTEDSPWKAYCLFGLNTALCHKDEAFKWLSYKPHHAWLAWNFIGGLPKCFKGDARFEEFLKELNLPQFRGK
jgi:TolB-like protein/Flp pilus assembly protein TadD